MSAPDTAARYERGTLVEVLIYHQQRCSDSGCHCGWGVLGASWSEHVADMYEQAMRDVHDELHATFGVDLDDDCWDDADEARGGFER